MRHLVLGIAVAVTSLMPVFGMADDQQIAEYVKSRLKSEQDAGNLKGFDVDMRVDGGTVWFEGFVSSPEQQMTILRAAQQAGHLGVVQVVDDIAVRAPASYQPAPTYASEPALAVPNFAAQPVVSNPVQPASYRVPALVTTAAPTPEPTFVPVQQHVETYNEPLPFAVGEAHNSQLVSVSNAGPAPSPASYSGGGISGQPVSAGYGGGPVPAGYGGQPGASGPANLPGYAWPAYAASPNYSAVSYPRQHSASAWPYIGPFYPYPQVPLGWRKVTLEWDDGFWNLDFNDK